MNAPQLENKKGFTIIEVVLVLAIAALIFLMVFIALPALQRNQRDTARKNQMSKVLSAVTSYQSNNRGKNPVDATGDFQANFEKYVDGTISNGTITLNGEYTLTTEPTPGTGTVSGTTSDNMVLVFGYKCGDTEGTVVDGNNRQSAILMQLENADAYYCQDS